MSRQPEEPTPKPRKHQLRFLGKQLLPALRKKDSAEERRLVNAGPSFRSYVETPTATSRGTSTQECRSLDIDSESNINSGLSVSKGYKSNEELFCGPVNNTSEAIRKSDLDPVHDNASGNLERSGEMSDWLVIDRSDTQLDDCLMSLPTPLSPNRDMSAVTNVVYNPSLSAENRNIITNELENRSNLNSTGEPGRVQCSALNDSTGYISSVDAKNRANYAIDMNNMTARSSKSNKSVLGVTKSQTVQSSCTSQQLLSSVVDSHSENKHCDSTDGSVAAKERSIDPFSFDEYINASSINVSDNHTVNSLSIPSGSQNSVEIRNPSIESKPNSDMSSRPNSSTEPFLDNTTVATNSTSLSSNTPLCGYLNKYKVGSRLSAAGPKGLTANLPKIFKKRWFVFSDVSCSLLYYRSPEDLIPLGQISIGRATFTFEPSSLEGAGVTVGGESRCNIFEIRSEDRRYWLEAKDRHTMMYWLQELQRHRREYRKRGSQAGTSEGAMGEGLLSTSTANQVSFNNSSSNSPTILLDNVSIPQGTIGQPALDEGSSRLAIKDLSVTNLKVELRNLVSNMGSNRLSKLSKVSDSSIDDTSDDTSAMISHNSSSVTDRQVRGSAPYRSISQTSLDSESIRNSNLSAGESRQNLATEESLSRESQRAGGGESKSQNPTSHARNTRKLLPNFSSRLSFRCKNRLGGSPGPALRKDSVPEEFCSLEYSDINCPSCKQLQQKLEKSQEITSMNENELEAYADMTRTLRSEIESLIKQLNSVKSLGESPVIEEYIECIFDKQRQISKLENSLTEANDRVSLANRTIGELKEKNQGLEEELQMIRECLGSKEEIFISLIDRITYLEQLENSMTSRLSELPSPGLPHSPVILRSPPSNKIPPSGDSECNSGVFQYLVEPVSSPSGRPSLGSDQQTFITAPSSPRGSSSDGAQRETMLMNFDEPSTVQVRGDEPKDHESNVSESYQRVMKELENVQLGSTTSEQKKPGHQEQQLSQPGQPFSQPEQPFSQSGQPLSQPEQPFSQSGQPLSQTGQSLSQPGQPLPQSGQSLSQTVNASPDSSNVQHSPRQQQQQQQQPSKSRSEGSPEAMHHKQQHPSHSKQHNFLQQQQFYSKLVKLISGGQAGSPSGATATTTRLNQEERSEMEHLRDLCRAYKLQNQFLNQEILDIDQQLKDEEKRSEEFFRRHADLEAMYYQTKSKLINCLRQLSQPVRDENFNDEIVSQLMKEAMDSFDEASTKDSRGFLSSLKGGSAKYDEYGFDRSESSILIGGLNASPLSLAEHFQQRGEQIENRSKKSEASVGVAVKLEKYLASLSGDRMLPHCQDLKELIRAGVPSRSLRTKLWRACIESKVYRKDGYYRKLVERGTAARVHHQIEIDLLRTLPNNRHYTCLQSDGIAPLRNVLLAFAVHNPNIGYCQGLNRLVAIMLLFLDEETSFWGLVAIVECIMPEQYYDHTLIAAHADQRALKDLVQMKLPHLASHFNSLNFDLSLFTFSWFLTIFIDNIPVETYLRVWDTFLYEGSKVLFRYTVAALKCNEEKILEQRDLAALHGYMRNIGSTLNDVDHLTKVAFQDLNPFPMRLLTNKRQQHLQKLKVELAELEQMRRSFEGSIRRKENKDTQSDEDN